MTCGFCFKDLKHEKQFALPSVEYKDTIWIVCEACRDFIVDVEKAINYIKKKNDM